MQRRRNRGMTFLIVLLFLAGLAFRLAPLFNQGGRLLRQFPTEDAYLMLTVARNLAIGNGMSTADGTIPTNGVQPVATFLWAGCYRLVQGDKVAGVALVQVVEIAIAVLSALLLYIVGRVVFHSRPGGRSMAALAASLWFAAPLSVEHSQNCLETGAYTLSVIAVALAIVIDSHRRDRSRTLPFCINLGAMLGFTFWVRNDAALLILAAGLTRLVFGSRIGGQRVGRVFTETMVIGATSVGVALPWLIYNKIYFGNIVPISGISEAAFVTFGTNILRLPPKLAEYALMIGAIPSSLETQPLVLALCCLIIVVLALILIYVWLHADHPTQALLSLAIIYGIGLCIFYGLFFGAGHFMSRYLFPLSPFFALFWVVVAFAFWDWFKTSRLSQVRLIVPTLAVLVIFAVNIRLYLKGNDHMHFQVVEWVKENVSEDAWIGAPQTGTLGYFHDRTINLDGKVNPDALHARLAGEIPQYIIDHNIDYLVDWVGLSCWTDLPILKPYYELIVEDHDKNLAVLRRRQG